MRNPTIELIRWWVYAVIIALGCGAVSGLVIEHNARPGSAAGSMACFFVTPSMLLVFALLRFRSQPQPEPKPPPEPPKLQGPTIEATDTVLGQSIRNGILSPYYVCPDRALRNRHTYIIGKTRTGKTTLLKQMMIQDMERGDGLAFIDPHGDAAEELLGLVPDYRVDDVIYFDPTKAQAPAFNPFRLPYAPPKLAEDFVSVFKMLVGDSSWGPRMEHLLRFGILALLGDSKPHCLRDLRALFIDDTFRDGVVRSLASPQLVEFWEKEYPSIPDSAANPILNKLSAFLAPTSDLERVFSSRENDIDFSKIFLDQKILIVNLAKGAIGDEPSRLLGGLMVTGLQQAALARASLPPDERTDFYLYVDEFHNFTVASFATILAESAKYRLALTLANQTLSQLSSSLVKSIFGNCGTIMTFQVSADDAPALCKEMRATRIVARRRGDNDVLSLAEFIARQNRLREEPEPSPFAEYEGIEVKALNESYDDWEFREIPYPESGDLTNLAPYHAYCRLGSGNRVSFIRCIPTPEPDGARREEVLANWRRYRREPAPVPIMPVSEPASWRE